MIKYNSIYRVDLEMFLNDDGIVINIRFKATGEIRQWKVSVDWLFKKLFKSHLKTCEKHGETLIVDKLSLR